MSDDKISVPVIVRMSEKLERHAEQHQIPKEFFVSFVTEAVTRALDADLPVAGTAFSVGALAAPSSGPAFRLRAAVVEPPDAPTLTVVLTFESEVAAHVISEGVRN